MSLPVNISDLLYQRIVESTRIEYKADWNPEPVLHSICAFANDIDNCGGGYIVLGVEEKDGKAAWICQGHEYLECCGQETDCRAAGAPLRSRASP